MIKIDTSPILISFIIPAYNCSKTIESCVHSILNAGITNIEILIINDCSIDKTSILCHQLSLNNPCIKLFNNKINLGTSSTRNIGIENAQGKYIWFVDSDDSINSAFLQTLEYLLNDKPDLDMLCFNHRNIFSTNETVFNGFLEYSCSISGLEYLNKYKSLYLWDKIYSRILIGKNRFIEGTKNIEDLYFNLQIISKAKHIYTTNKIGYNYNCTTQFSTSRNRNLKNLVKLSSDTMVIHRLIADDITKCQDLELKDSLKNILNYSIAGHFFSLFRFYNIHYINRIIKIYKTWHLYPVKYTNNTKANLFITLINSQFIFISSFKFLSKFK